MLVLSEHPLQTAELEATVQSHDAGATVVFIGTARSKGQEGAQTLALHYESYLPMAMLELERIATEAYARWPGLKLAIAHRLGEVALGEAAVVIAVSTPHRAAAYEASRFLIEELKAKVPIWKKEIYSDGSSWTSNRP